MRDNEGSRRIVIAATLASLATGCPDDTVDNPFNSTEAASSGTAATEAPGDDGPDDDGQDTTAAGASTGPAATDDAGTTVSVVDESSSGEPGSSTSVASDPSSSDGGESSSSTGAGEASSSSTGGEPPDFEPCPAGVLPNAPLPNTVSGNSAGEDSEFSGGCGGGGAPDMAYTFTAPADGPYTFDTAGSSFDTVLSVRDGTCEGAVLVCDDDGLPGTTQSMASVELVQDQVVTVVVDSFGLAGGAFNLTVREGSVTCPVADLGSTVPQTVSGQTVVATDQFALSCAAFGGAGDNGFIFTAPQDATYTFEITNNTFDTNMAILDGSCEGPEIACNTDLAGAVGGASGLFVGLSAGQVATIVVEGDFGATGNYDLNIGMLGGTCPDDDLGNMAVPFTVMGSTSGEDNATAGTCGGLTSADFAYTWTVPADAMYGFNTTGSAYDTVVYVLDGSCTGAQLACSNDSQGMMTSNAIAQLSAGQDVVIVVDGFGAEGDFTLTVDETLDSGNCCFTHAELGCDDQAVEDCVCAIDSFCCNTSWDGLCVNEAIDICNATCA